MPFIALIWLVLASCALADRKAHPFTSFYPDYAKQLMNITRQNCSSQLHYYRTHHGYEGCLACAIRPFTDCVLQALGETYKANMAAAGVLLGLLPTVLSMAGTTTIETGLLCLRRPLLAMLIGAGSTSVAPMRTSEYKEASELLKVRKAAKPPRSQRPLQERLLVVLEYIFAAAAIVNNGQASVELGKLAVCSVSPETSFTPVVWAFLAIPVHMFGAAAVFLRTKLTEEEDTAPPAIPIHLFWPRLNSNIFHWIKHEFRLSSSHPKATLATRKETNLFLFISWFTSTGIVLHIIYGTVVLSATLFVSSKDALGIVGRYFASTLVCRAILTYEMRGIRQQVTASDGELSTAEDHRYTGQPKQIALDSLRSIN